jgi:mannitol 2-dehydrogenase
MPALANDTLQKLPEAVEIPRYQRSSATVGIVHFGVGGFHRAHEAMYVDRLMNLGLGQEWGICGVGVMPVDRSMAAALQPQDGLYTMVVKHADGRRELRVIGSLIDFRYAPDDPERVLEVLCAAGTRIVSLTITEGGYNFNQVTHEFDADNPAIVADLRPGATPSTVFGYVIEALARRRAKGLAPLTIMSCDNIQSNGDMARRMFTAFAQLKDPQLAAWIDESVRFPNSMVDRITPATTEADRVDLAAKFDVEDRWPVVCEPFTQWVLEDDFSAGRPPFEEAGVQVVSTVEPYELMKLRLLNGSHQALCYFGYLMGYRFVDEAARDSRIVAFLKTYMDAEASPTLLPVPGVDLEAYKAELIERFSNPEIRDTVARLCAESSDRIPKWLLPVLRKNLATGGQISHTAAVVASWARYAEGVDEHGAPIQIVDRLAETITPLARSYPTDPTALLSVEELFGDLGQDERFRSVYLAVLRSLHAFGAAHTLEQLNTGQLSGQG